MIRTLLLSSAVVIAVAGCATQYTAASALSPGDLPAAFEQKAPANAPVWPTHDWWTSYGDPQLSALMQQAEADNLDIAQAAARLRKADARASPGRRRALAPGGCCRFGDAAIWPGRLDVCAGNRAISTPVFRSAMSWISGARTATR